MERFGKEAGTNAWGSESANRNSHESTSSPVPLLHRTLQTHLSHILHILYLISLFSFLFSFQSIQ